MTYPSGGFDDLMSGFFGGKPTVPATPRTSEKPVPQIRGKEINGVLYVRADDVADALESQAPGPCRRLIAKLRRRG